MPSKTSAQDSCPVCHASSAVHYLTTTDRFHAGSEEYHLHRCHECSCVWLANPPVPEEMGQHYSSDYHKAITLSGESSPESRWGWARDAIRKYHNAGSILDVGCSSGAFLSVMNDGSWKLFGIEMESSTAQRAESSTGARVFVGDALAAPFAANSFDVITSFDLLEHVYHPMNFLAKVHEWLKPGGIYFVAVPNVDSWEARLFKSYWYGLELPRHLTHFSPRSLRQAMASLKFKERSLTTSGVSYAEHSLTYIRYELLSRNGISSKPPAQAQQLSFVYRGIRKAFRLGLFEPFGNVAGSAGGGASILGVFEK